MKKFLPIILIVAVIAIVNIIGATNKGTSSKFSNEKTAFTKPEINKNICLKDKTKLKTNELTVKGIFNKSRLSLQCEGSELRYHFFSDYIAGRGTYEVRCEKSDFRISLTIRNPKVNELLRPHIPYREVPPNFSFMLKKGEKVVSQKDTQRNMTHNVESLLYLSDYEFVGESSTKLTGCMEFEFANDIDLASAKLDINFDLLINRKNK